MTVEKIANRQLLFMLFIMRSIAPIAILPILTIGTAEQDSWVSVIIATAASLIIVLLVVGLSVKFPGMTMVEYSQVLLGKVVGRIVAFIPLWAFLHIAATELRLYGELINTAFLPQTPLVFIMSSLVFLSVIVVYLGIEVLGRVADVMMVWFVIFVTISIILPLPEISLSHFEPFLSQGMGPILSSSLAGTGLIVFILVVPILMPSISNHKKGVNTSLWATLLSMLLLLIITFVVIGKLGPLHGSRVVFPFLVVVRNLEAGELLQRLEIFLILAWGLGLFVAISVYLYCGVRGVAQWFNVQNYRPLVAPMAIMWITLSIHGYENIFQITDFFTPEIFFPYNMALIFIPFSLLWTAYLVRKVIGREEST